MPRPTSTDARGEFAVAARRSSWSTRSLSVEESPTRPRSRSERRLAYAPTIRCERGAAGCQRGRRHVDLPRVGTERRVANRARRSGRCRAVHFGGPQHVVVRRPEWRRRVGEVRVVARDACRPVERQRAGDGRELEPGGRVMLVVAPRQRRLYDAASDASIRRMPIGAKAQVSQVAVESADAEQVRRRRVGVGPTRRAAAANRRHVVREVPLDRAMLGGDQPARGRARVCRGANRSGDRALTPGSGVHRQRSLAGGATRLDDDGAGERAAAEARRLRAFEHRDPLDRGE